MINRTNLKISERKYGHIIDEVMHDSTGYWIWLNENYISTQTGCHSIHECTQKNLLASLKTIKPIENNAKKPNFKYIYCYALDDMVIEEFYHKGTLYTFNIVDLVYYSNDENENKMFNEVPNDATPNK